MTQHNTVRAKGKEHFPNYPRGFTVLRIFQLVFSFIILAVVSYTVYIVAFDGNCLMLFTAIATFIASLYMVIANQCAPQLYNYWAVLSLDIFLLLFWLISFALLAAQTAYFWAASSDYCDYYTCYYGTLSGSALVFGAILAAASGLGALEFLFFFISLIIHSIAMCRHRRAGLHCNAVPSGTAPVAVAVPVQIHPQGMINYQGAQYAAPVGQNAAFNTQPVYNQAPPPQGFQPQQQLNEKQPSSVGPQGQQQFFPPQSQQQQQQFYNQPPPIVSQPTGNTFQQTPAVQHSSPSPPQPPQGTYQPPYNQPTPPPGQAVYQAPTYPSQLP
ncbi:hypothetical protein BGZ61DRAFT_132744 [Ilyonectria robusta]|uniref:uncharacterized protein n=1 Tax=Ilyonectria robusta TaxID=1079257 RepID=UPI001E8CF584|nr:uncharacterized protein BGZ61DRAFT_132744 [Ilyonectria robusta]KAH8734955.1 hypothetical protein BGZ61DRAFT_132744 [Ilyonectria robusta]